MAAEPLGLGSAHKDIVHDAAFDFYGKYGLIVSRLNPNPLHKGERLATVGADHRLRVWEQVKDGGWVQASELKTVGNVASFSLWPDMRRACSRVIMLQSPEYVGLTRNSVKFWRQAVTTGLLSFGKRRVSLHSPGFVHS